MDTDIDETVRSCDECQLNQANPPLAPLNPWKWPSRPWPRLHLDYAGPFQDRNFLMVIDAHSKWIEAFPATSPSTSVTIELLRPLFAQFGLPETIVTDSSSCFVSADFQYFLTMNGIKHITSAPYHPSTNGLTERAIQIVKKGLKKVTEGSIRSRIAKVLLAYRTTPHSTTGSTPASLLLGRNPHTRLDLLKPNTAEQIESKELIQKKSYDSSVKSCLFSDDQPVLARNFGRGHKWLKGEIIKFTGPVSYLVKLQNGIQVHHHQDQIHKHVETSTNVTVTDKSVEESLSAPTIVTDFSPSDTVSLSSRQHPQCEHRLPVRYRDSGN